ncbi:acyl-CoA synthetase [Ideonella sp. A 288]|uniref:acyl-CoA synthetase n=1 Tax=Ideonella sp. A 288 TaxID=1962181 RepID=UPI000B4B86AF|nr:acyl-CoA synthetase [Ideonella sp. A 288]
MSPSIPQGRGVATLADIEAVERAAPLESRLPPGGVWTMLEAAGDRHADRPALSFLPNGDPHEPAQTWTHGQLLMQCRRLANWLHAQGVRSPAGVAVLMPNLPQTYVALFGSQAAAVVCPISPTLGAAAVAGILVAGGCEVLVAEGPARNPALWQRACAAAALAPGLRHVLVVGGLVGDMGVGMPAGLQVHDFDLTCASQRGDRLDFKPSNEPQSPTARFHTGGTTGAPKLATHTQRNQVYLAWCMGEMVGFNPQDVVLIGLPLFHVHAVIPLSMGPLSRGAHLVLLGPQGFRHASVIHGFWRIVERFGATCFSAVPTVYAGLLQVPIADARVGSLRVAFSGSAPLARQVAQDVQARTGLVILEGYGLTEGTCISTLSPLRGERRIGSIGLRLPYQAMKVARLDEQGRWLADCAPGEAGHLLIQGPNVFAGYADAAQTAAAFAAPGWLDTGDLGHCDADGYFWISGRAKDLIKRSGHSIDPQGVEEALHADPAIALAAVVARPDARAGEVPVAFVSLKPGALADPAQLLAACRQRLGDPVAAPVQLTVLQQLPMTAVGKLDKVALRALAAADNIN